MAPDVLQLPLLEWPAEDRAQLVEPDPDPRDGSIEARAERFHAANPQVYRMAVRVARHIKARGAAHYGIGAIWEILRFRYLETTGDVYRLNNNYRAFYARRIMERESDLAGFFHIRETAHDPDYRARAVRVTRGHRSARAGVEAPATLSSRLG